MLIKAFMLLYKFYSATYSHFQYADLGFSTESVEDKKYTVSNK